jgi:NAD(P)-dependent dehydrogenase (short-subunit alcohol dehydrogenase family)
MGDSCADRVALVTGGSRGIGRAIALRLVSEGAAVALVARDVDGERLGRSLAGTVAEINDAGGRAVAIGADLGDPSVSRSAVVEDAANALGPVDILVNNAAMSLFRDVADWSDKALRLMIELNVVAPWQLIQAALPGMLERNTGWIVNISSGVGEASHARPGGAAYGGSKAMLDQMTRCLALELDGTRVTANVVSPQGASRTEFVNQLVDQDVLDEGLTEPLEVMAEAALALATAPPSVRGLVVRSLELLSRLDRPVHELDGETVLTGYDVADLKASMASIIEVAGQSRDLRGAWGKDW